MSLTSYIATDRKMLASLIVTIPMDEDVMIYLKEKHFTVRYRFPAVMRSDGSEIEPRLGYWRRSSELRKDIFVPSNPSPEAHREYQIKRRARIAAKVRQRQWKVQF